MGDEKSWSCNDRTILLMLEELSGSIMVRLLSLSPNSTSSSTELALEVLVLVLVLVDSQLMERLLLLLTNGMVGCRW